MNKKDIMRQPDMESLIRALIKSKPGVTSARLFESAKEWAGCSEENETDSKGRLWLLRDTMEFEGVLAGLIAEGYICTNKQWQEKGYLADRETKGPPKTDPRQLRMDW